jgi:glucan biosynthesis protein C
MATNTPGKDLKIETIRGLALFLMVAGHVIGYTSTRGMEVADDSVLRYLYNSLIDVRMPLFTAISGFVYALRPVSRGSSLSRFCLGKIRRMIVPLFVVSTLFFISQAMLPGTNNAPSWSEMPSIYVSSYAHFWFLQAIFCIFVLVSLLEKTGCLNSPGKLLAAFAIAAAASLNSESFPEFFSISSAAKLLPSFLLGVALCRFPKQFINTPNVTVIGALLVAVIVTDQAELWAAISLNELEITVVGTVLGLAAIYMLIARRFFFAPLAWLGYYSFEIYLFHVFGTAGTRIALNKLSIDNAWITFIASMLAGMLLPVLLKKMVERYNLFNLAFFGAYAKKKQTVELSLAPIKPDIGPPLS